MVESNKIRSEQREIEEKLRKLTFKKKTLTDYERASAIMNAINIAIQDLTEEQFVICTPIFARYLNEVVRISPPSLAKGDPEFIRLSKLIGEAARAVVQAEHDELRKRRLAHREPVQAVVMEGRKCSRCKKRPAKFDNLCGRCAEETGARTKGKV